MVQAVFPPVAVLHQFQHLQNNGPEGTRKLLCAVGLSKGRDVHERRSALAQVQRCVIGVITQISGEQRKFYINHIFIHFIALSKTYRAT